MTPPVHAHVYNSDKINLHFQETYSFRLDSTRAARICDWRINHQSPALDHNSYSYQKNNQSEKNEEERETEER